VALKLISFLSRNGCGQLVSFCGQGCTLLVRWVEKQN